MQDLRISLQWWEPKSVKGLGLYPLPQELFSLPPRMLLFSPLAAQFFSLPIILHQACSHDALANHSSVSQSSLSAWQVKFCGAWSFYIWGQCALAFSGCQNKAPQTGCLKQQPPRSRIGKTRYLAMAGVACSFLATPPPTSTSHWYHFAKLFHSFPWSCVANWCHFQRFWPELFSVTHN